MAACLLYDITGFAKLNEKTLKKEGADFECIWKIKQCITNHWALLSSQFTWLEIIRSVLFFKNSFFYPETFYREGISPTMEVLKVIFELKNQDKCR